MLTRSLPVILASLIAAGAVAAVWGTTRLVRNLNDESEAAATYEVSYKGRESLRILAAIVPHGKQAWFFYLAGPAEEVAKQQAAFAQFLDSVKFADAQEPPFTWKAPKGWTHERGGGKFRLATFRIEGGARPLELTVTTLDARGGGLLANLNRWRKKINLPPLDETNVAQNVQRRVVGDESATLVDFTGLGTHTVSEPQQASRRDPHDLNLGPARGRLPFTYEMPDGWRKVAAMNMMIVEALEVGQGRDRVSITMMPAGGALAANINRWRDQVGLPRVPADEAARSAVDLTVAGRAVKVVDIANPKAPVGRPARILAALVPEGDQTWFLKMTGPHDAVGTHKAAFERFVKSLKFGGR